MKTNNYLSKIIKYINIKTISSIILILFVIASIASITGNNKAKNNEPEVISGFYFDTFIKISIYDDITSEHKKRILNLLLTYDTIFSPTNKDSLTTKVNANQTNYVNIDYAKTLSDALEIATDTNGAVDPSILGVYELYDFSPDNKINPSEDDILSKLAFVDYTSISLDGITVHKPDETKIGFGYIAKGYIAEAIKDELLTMGYHNATIDLGGNILFLGDKNGQFYTTAIVDPFYDRLDDIFYADYEYSNEFKDFSDSYNPDLICSIDNIRANEMALASMKVSDVSVVTSGIYERYYIDQNGKIMHHILDPETGYPVDNELVSVTIIGPNSEICDAYSTACFVMGTEKAIDYLSEKADYSGMFITKCGDVIFTEDFPYELTK